MSDLQRVLAALDALRVKSGYSLAEYSQACQALMAADDASRVIRDLAADFDEYADHGHTCKAILTPGFFAPDLCDCGYAERVEKWRLEP